MVLKTWVVVAVAEEEDRWLASINSRGVTPNSCWLGVDRRDNAPPQRPVAPSVPPSACPGHPPPATRLPGSLPDTHTDKVTANSEGSMQYAYTISGLEFSVF